MPKDMPDGAFGPQLQARIGLLSGRYRLIHRDRWKPYEVFKKASDRAFHLWHQSEREEITRKCPPPTTPNSPSARLCSGGKYPSVPTVKAAADSWNEC
jgi:hypothetical protein